MKKFRAVFACLILCLSLSGCASAYREGVDDLEEGEYEEAVENFTKEIEDGKNVAESWRGIGLAYYEQGDYARAAEALSEALNAGAEETATICGLLGDCQYSLGDYSSAISWYEQGLALGDGSESLNQGMAFNIISAYEQMGDYDSAKEQLETYVSQYPDDETAQKEAEFLETR